MNHLTAAGLVYDIAGVVLLAWAIIRVPAVQIPAQAGTFWGGRSCGAILRAAAWRRRLPLYLCLSAAALTTGPLQDGQLRIVATGQKEDGT